MPLDVFLMNIGVVVIEFLLEEELNLRKRDKL